MHKICFLLALVMSLLACQSNTTNEATTTPGEQKNKTTSRRAKFEPQDGKCILFAGQELEAIGGLAEYSDGYYDHFAKPGGFTMYTDFMPGATSFGFVHRGLDGLTTTDNWGDGPSNMALQIADPDFDQSALAIGLDMKEDHEDDVANGTHDALIIRLGEWIKALDRRPVFLRIGYEFDGHPWNSYQREDYVAAFKRVRHMLDSMGVENVAYVWQSKGRGSIYQELEEWYPGDEYVDWCAYSFFAGENEKHPMLDFARAHQKPVFLAEATPIVLDSAKQSLPIDLANEEQAQQAWDEWFVPFFRTIHDNPDLVKAVSYINCHWKAHAMWKENDYFKGIDARLHLSPMISKKWRAETQDSRYLQASEVLFEELWKATQ